MVDIDDLITADGGIDMAAFGRVIGMMDTKSGPDGDTNATFPRSDANDMGNGARFIPGEVTDARRAGKKVDFVRTCSACCWYWEFPDGMRIYHFDPIVYDGMKDGGYCTRCSNPHISGGTVQPS